MIADYHTHTILCKHAEGTCCDYVDQALALGLSELGFSDHNPMPKIFDDWRMDLSDWPRYLEMVAEAKAYGATRGLPVRLGLEVDWLDGGEAWIETLSNMAEFDYLIGAVHYISDDWAIDDPALIHRWDECSIDETWALYWKKVENCIRSGLFDFIAHPDLPKKFGHVPEGDLRPFYEPVIRALADTGTGFEINLAGLRKPIGEAYSTPLFLEMAHEADLALVISSDAHAPKEVGGAFETGIGLAKQAGFTKLSAYHQRSRTLVDL